MKAGKAIFECCFTNSAFEGSASFIEFVDLPCISSFTVVSSLSKFVVDRPFTRGSSSISYIGFFSLLSKQVHWFYYDFR